MPRQLDSFVSQLGLESVREQGVKMEKVWILIRYFLLTIEIPLVRHGFWRFQRPPAFAAHISQHKTLGEQGVLSKTSKEQSKALKLPMLSHPRLVAADAQMETQLEVAVEVAQDVHL